MGSLYNAMRAAVAAFRKEWLASDTVRNGWDVYGTYNARLLRYALYWAFYENTAYDGTMGPVHRWAPKFKTDFGLYRNTRGVFNPGYRLGEFWSTAVYGGRLDPAAGDGSKVPSAMPIATEDESVRPAIAQLWRSSNWQVNKGVWTRRGAVLGDAPLKVVLDEDRGHVSVASVHPKTLRDVRLDPCGNVISYVIEENRPDPEAPAEPYWMRGNERLSCLYHEVAELDGDKVVFRTFRNESPYGWDGNPPEWESPCPFVPLVLARHLDFGHPAFGMSEFHGALAKVMECDDLGSKVDDQVRKAVEAVWFFSGMKAVDLDAAKARKRPARDDREPERQETLTITSSDPQAKAMALVADLDFAGIAQHTAMLLDDRLQDYPELRFDRIRASGDASAKALREARKPAELKVQERRAGYDDVFVRAAQMAIALGGEVGLPGYEGFGLDAYRGGDIAFSIGERTVFDLDPLDRCELDQAEATAAQTWVLAGVPLEMALRRAGWREEDIVATVEAKAKADAARAREAAAAATIPTAQSQGQGQEQGR